MGAQSENRMHYLQVSSSTIDAMVLATLFPNQAIRSYILNVSQGVAVYDAMKQDLYARTVSKRQETAKDTPTAKSQNL